MPRWGMVIDLDRCTACQACTIACRNENNIPFAGPDHASKGRAIFWNQVLPFKEEGEQGYSRIRFTPLPCMHCDRPSCIKVCPVRATYKSEEGIVFQIFARCIGCRLCMCACPYSRRFYNWSKGHWPEIMQSAFNPDVSLRPLGVVEKCTFCIQRSREGKYPSCVEICPVGARKFGNLLDPDSEIRYILENKRVLVLKQELNTQPKFYYFFGI